MQKLKLAIVLLVILLSVLACKSESTPSASAVSGPPINTQFQAAAIEPGLKALQAKVGNAAQVVEMTIHPARLDVLVLHNGEGKSYAIIEGKLQPDSEPARKEMRSGIPMDTIKVNDILATMSKQPVGGQLAYIHIEKAGATGYYFSAQKSQTIKTDLDGKPQ